MRGTRVYELSAYWEQIEIILGRQYCQPSFVGIYISIKKKVLQSTNAVFLGQLWCDVCLINDADIF